MGPRRPTTPATMAMMMMSMLSDDEHSTTLTTAGFPFSVLEFDDLTFADSCPEEVECSSSDNMLIIIIAIVAGVVGLLGLVCIICYCKKKKAASPPHGATTVQMTSAGSNVGPANSKV